MTQAEKILRDKCVRGMEPSDMSNTEETIYPAMKEIAWKAWNEMCNMHYSLDDEDTRMKEFEKWYNKQVKEETK